VPLPRTPLRAAAEAVPLRGVVPAAARLADRCPSRGRRYEPLRKQSRFEGSFRQRRAALLRLVTVEAQPVEAVDTEAVESLCRDGLVVVADGVVALPG
jgi:hypothetical protein